MAPQRPHRRSLFIHWFQQFYPVVLPALKSGLNLSNVEVGALTSVQQVAVGLGQLPSGRLADARALRRSLILTWSLVSMGGVRGAAVWLGRLGADRNRHGALIAGYFTARLGIKFAFVLSRVLLIVATLVLMPLQLYRGARNY